MLKGHGLDGHGDLDIRLPEHLLETVEGEARFGNYLHNEESAAAAAAIAGEKRAAPAAAPGAAGRRPRRQAAAVRGHRGSGRRRAQEGTQHLPAWPREEPCQ